MHRVLVLSGLGGSIHPLPNRRSIASETAARRADEDVICWWMPDLLFSVWTTAI